jgi:hypothetical protein
MLGFYANFPKTIHGIKHFAVSVSIKKLQQVLVETFQKLNNETLSLESIADPSIPQCKVNLEFGIAEAGDFNYLNGEEENRVQKEIRKKPFQVLDFLCAVRYYRMQEERKTPLRFDYYMLRFTFGEDSMDTQVFHERGPRYLSPEDVTNIVCNKVNETFSKRILKALDAS